MSSVPLTLYGNLCQTTVTSGGTTAPAAGTVETWTVASGAAFPVIKRGAQVMHIADTSPSASSEMMTILATSGSTFTVLRGAENTTPVAHAPGFTIIQVVTAGDLAGLQYAPWQFSVQAYGAVGDGHAVYDGAMTSGSPTLTTPGLSAPATPTVATAATGGTILAGTYQVKVSYVGQYGETLACTTAASVTTTGSTSTITITITGTWPVGATGWYAYVTQAGGSTFTRQQPAGYPSPPPPLANPNTYQLTAPPTATGAGLPASNTTPSNPFSSADVGKYVLVVGAAAAGVSTLCAPITGFTNSGQVTLGANASATVGPCWVLWATDDTTAFQAAINAATAYASAQQNNAYAEVIIPPAQNGSHYGIAGGLVTGASTWGNAQLTIPVVNRGVTKPTIVFKGMSSASAWEHWMQTQFQPAGSTMVSYSPPYANATNQGNALNANGMPVMLGGPGIAGGFGLTVQNDVLFSNMYVILDGIHMVTPYSSNALQYGCFDFSGIAQAKVTNCCFDVTTTTENTWAGTGEGGLATGWSAAGFMPQNANNDTCYLTDVSVAGGYRRGMLLTEHTDAFGLRVLYCYAAIAIVGNYLGGVGASHAFNIGRMSVESCPVLMEILGKGQGGVGPIVGVGQLDTEAGSPTFTDDGNGGMAAAQGIIGLTGLFTLANLSVPPTSLQVINWQQKPGFVTAPAVPASGVAFKNTFWRWATVTLNGGTSITAVALGSTMGGTTAPTMNNVFTQTSAALSTVTVRVPPGGWISWTGTGTAPTWFWMLD